jgi:hypothetical protein
VFELVSAVPAWAWLTLLVGLSFGIRAALALRDPSPWIFPDEIFYSELAKSLAHTGHFALRDIPGTGGFGVFYSTLISPAWALFESLPRAYQAAKVINALLMSLSAVPVYLLARRLAPTPLALAASGLALALPGMVYTGTLMTENAFFPVFLFWVLALVLALERPTALRQLVAVGLTFLAYLTRSQGAVLAPALVTAIAVFVLLEAWSADGPFGRTALRRAAAFAVTWATLLVGVGAFLALEIGSRGKSFSSALLGPYSALTGSTYSVHAALRWGLYELGELDFATGVLPFAAFLLLLAAGLRRAPASREAQAFAAVAGSATAWLVLEVALFASTPFGQQIQERNLFFLEPLFLIALVAWAGGLIPRSGAATGAAALVAFALVAVVPYDSFISPRIYSNAVGLLPLLRLEQHGWVAPSHLSDVVVLAALAAGLLFILLPRRLALLAPVVVLLYLSVMNSPVEGLTHQASGDSRRGGIGGRLDWIDRAVGTKPQVSFLWTGAPDVNFVSLWVNEFFNRSVGSVYNIHGPPDGLPQETLTFDYRSAQYRHANGDPVSVKYLLTDRSQTPTGTLVASDEGTGMMLYRVDGPLQLSYETQGIYRDAWSGPSATFTIYDCRGGRLRLALLSDPHINPYRQHIVARDSGSGRVLARTVSRPNAKVVRFAVPVPSGQSTCRIAFTVSPTGVPAERIQSGDTRQLGIRFLHPAYEPR